MEHVKRTFCSARIGLKKGWKACGAFVRNNGSRVAYYALVALVLCAIGRAAEIYRGGGGAEEPQLILPAADMLTPVFQETEEKEELLCDRGELTCIRAYSDVPEWDAALGQWSAHPATDFVGADGRVESLSAGTVRTVGKSGVYGGFVEIENGTLLLRYASVEPVRDLAPGDEVQAGDCIGIMDASMPGEAHLGAHLHLELYDGDAAADLADYTAKNPSAMD